MALFLLLKFQKGEWNIMLNDRFLTEFTDNFIQQVKKFLNIDGYLVYAIDSSRTCSQTKAVNIPNKSIIEYQQGEILNDPVSFHQFYSRSHQYVALLNEHSYSLAYADFLKRWRVQDTAEIFFRKRNGEPVFGMSLIKQQHDGQFNAFDHKILNSFYGLSEKYLHHHIDILDREYLSQSYQLTKKEIIVVEELLKGMNNHLIAENLSCSLATVKTHIQHIYQKINVANRQELMCKFLR